MRLKALLVLLVIIAVLIWLTAFASLKGKDVDIIACDVGQGDATLIQYKTNQILVDGGPGNKVLDCLSRHMPFFDRKIEFVVLTHPQEDHYGGLLDVFSLYDVEVFYATEAENTAASYQEFKKIVSNTDTRIIFARKGDTFRLGEIQMKTLSPSAKEFLNSTTQQVLGAYTTKDDLNDFSIVLALKIEEIDMLLTGDISPEISTKISEEFHQDIDILKVPHHGSKNGLSKQLLESTQPEIAVVSAGRKNRFGHPHSEIITMLEENNTKIFTTLGKGDIVLRSDGKAIILDQNKSSILQTIFN